MARTAMTVDNRPTPYATAPLDLATLRTFDTVNGMTMPATGDTALVFYNPNPTASSVTIHSVADPQQRVGDITYSVVQNHFVWFQEFPAPGWSNAGVVTIDATQPILYAAIKRAVGT